MLSIEGASLNYTVILFFELDRLSYAQMAPLACNIHLPMIIIPFVSRIHWEQGIKTEKRSDGRRRVNGRPRQPLEYASG